MTVDLQQEAHEKLATQDPVAPTERRIHRPAATQFIRRGVRRVKPVPLFSVSHHLFFLYLSSRTFIGNMFPHWSNQTTPFFLHFNRRPPLNSRHRCNTGSRTSFTFSLVASFHHRPPFNDRAKYKSTTFHSIGPSSSSYASHTATRQAHKRDKRFSSSQKTWQLAYQWQNLSPFRPRGAGA